MFARAIGELLRPEVKINKGILKFSIHGKMPIIMQDTHILKAVIHVIFLKLTSSGSFPITF